MVVFLIHWLVVALGLAAAAYLVPGVGVASGSALALGALVLGFVNAVVKPVLTLLTLPLTVVTLGLFYFVVNALALWITAGISSSLGLGFKVDGFWAAFLGALLVSLVNLVLSWFVGRPG